MLVPSLRISTCRASWITSGCDFFFMYWALSLQLARVAAACRGMSSREIGRGQAPAHRVAPDAQRALECGAQALQDGRNARLVVGAEAQGHRVEGLQAALRRRQVPLHRLPRTAARVTACQMELKGPNSTLKPSAVTDSPSPHVARSPSSQLPILSMLQPCHGLGPCSLRSCSCSPDLVSHARGCTPEQGRGPTFHFCCSRCGTPGRTYTFRQRMTGKGEGRPSSSA